MATLYLEIDTRYHHEAVSALSSVEIFGEFSYPNSWKVKVPCTYDTYFKCFKVDILI
jgi:hypothetical protein